MYALPYLLLGRIHRAAIDARRKDRTWRYLMWSALAGTMAALMMTIGALFTFVLFRYGMWPLGVVVLAIMVMPPIAGVLVRYAIVPLGWYRIAYWAGALCRPGADIPAYGTCVAAWALSRRPSPDGEAWLAKMRDARQPLGDAEVIVTALIAAGRGDAETARQLIRSAALLVENHPAVRELAYEWLAVDAAERGAWSELAGEVAQNAWPASPLAYLLEGVAQRRTNQPGAPRELELYARWLLAPYRRATLALLAIAPVEPGVTLDRDADAESTPAPERALLPAAISAHLAITSPRRTAPTPALLAHTVGAWDSALGDPATREWLARRALELDAPLGSVDRALKDVANGVADHLARIAEAATLGAPAARGAVGEGLSRRLRHGRLDALETGFARWAQRRHDGSIRLAIDEWREWLALRAAYTAAVAAGGLELRRLAFPHAFSTGTSMAVWLWNARKEYPLSHAISKWLLAEALIVGDTEAIELGHRNCRLTVPTRTGPHEET